MSDKPALNEVQSRPETYGSAAHNEIFGSNPSSFERAGADTAQQHLPSLTLFDSSNNDTASGGAAASAESDQNFGTPENVPKQASAGTGMETGEPQPPRKDGNGENPRTQNGKGDNPLTHNGSAGRNGEPGKNPFHRQGVPLGYPLLPPVTSYAPQNPRVCTPGDPHGTGPIRPVVRTAK